MCQYQLKIVVVLKFYLRVIKGNFFSGKYFQWVDRNITFYYLLQVEEKKFELYIYTIFGQQMVWLEGVWKEYNWKIRDKEGW